MIKTTSSQPGSAKATVIGSKTRWAFVGHAYEGFKTAGRVYGFYKDIEPYLPETAIDKYRYKPHKRVAQTLYETKGFLSKKRRKFHKKCEIYGRFDWYNNNKSCPR